MNAPLTTESIMTPEGRWLEEYLAAELSDTTLALPQVRVLQRVGSTNAAIVRYANGSTNSTPWLCLAREQTAGCGRRGRAWVSTDAGLALSLAWPVDPQRPVPSGYPVGVGLGVIRALESLGASGLGLKWPNDILHGHAKLAGILVEQHPPRVGRSGWLVAGIGINRRGSHTLDLGRAVTDLERLPGMAAPDWLVLAARVAAWQLRLHPLLTGFGLESMEADLQRLDWLSGRSVVVSESDIQGIARGICRETGRLWLEEPDSRIRALDAGEVSIREAAA